MATVLERFNHLGLASSSKVLMSAGIKVAEVFDEEEGKERLYPFPKKLQSEGNEKYWVRDYPGYWTERMDYVIILWAAGEYKKRKS